MRQAVTIAGGGLAGLALGIALRQRAVPVVLHEAGAYPRHRVCGEFICGVSDDTLNQLGIADCLTDATLCRSTAWYYRGAPVYRKRLPRPALGMSRYLLDERLASRFQALGGDLREHARLRTEDMTQEGLVCATGPRAVGKDWIGLKFHIDGLALAQDLELHFGHDAYLGLAKIEYGKVNACGLFRRQPGLSASKTTLPFAYLEASGLGYLLKRIPVGTVEAASISGVAGLSYGQAGEAPKAVFSIGDNAGLIPPFTGNGMSIAFESALLAIEPLVAWSAQESLWDTARSQAQRRHRQAFARRRWVANCLHPFLYKSWGQAMLGLVARCRLLPFTPLFNLTH